MITGKKVYLLLLLLPFFTDGCSNKKEAAGKLYFTLMNADETNINFSNTITESDSVNVFTNEYMYNGSGVGIGDFNNDGLPDIFFCGSTVSSKLYINKGNFKFEDVTVAAGLETNRWCTGVSIVDINNDGFMDIYICVSHSTDKDKRKNLLFINDGKLHFSEQAAAYGLADTGYSTQAAFFDYDKDGDLDMYLLNHRLYSHNANNLQPKDTSGNSPAQDRLYRNDGIPAGQTHPVFHDVSMQAGIKEDGYGLGIVITDVNNDNWPDIYVANDYIGNDLLWLNNKNGHFSNVISTSLKHQSYNSMGTDAADINNDGLPDLAVVDMLPETNDRKKIMFNGSSQEKYDMQQRFGYEPSFVRNMLQLNNGNREINHQQQPFYSEIGQLSGVFETDWSWSVLMADFDNDGWKDIHITNGLGKDVTNNDYASFTNGQAHTNYTFGGSNAAGTPGKNDMPSLRKNIDQYGSVKMNNYLFQNNHDLSFSNTSMQAGLTMASISNGAAYVDLDNDGDLDLVVNNINQPAFVWKNELRKSAGDSTNNYITIQLKGTPGNLSGYGSHLSLYSNGNKQYLEQSPVRGFSSSVDQRLHFGVGNSSVIDSIIIQWPDDKVQVLKNIKTNQLLTIDNSNGKIPLPSIREQQSKTFLNDVTDSFAFDFRHTEAQYFDFGSRRSLPQKYSQLGPGIATGDINGDGLIDFFEGGAANQSGKIFIQKTDGGFKSVNLIEGSVKAEEDVESVFFDADGDKDLDLLITGGSSEFGTDRYNQPRLYINDGAGNFKLDPDALPAISDITKAIAVADYDGDGDIDIFIGGRLLPQKYPQSPRSYLLQNNHGKFKDVTKEVCPSLEFAGMITSALFTDFNSDKKMDLITCGEWEPVRFFKNENNRFREVSGETGLAGISGLWRSLQQVDIDNDGDMDYIVGNMGWNNRYHITKEQPMFLYAKDMDNNGSTDIIPAYYIKDGNGKCQLFPALDRNQLAEQVPAVKKKYLLHKDYAKVTMQQLQSDYGESGWSVLKCETTSSVWLENLGNGKFKLHDLPVAAQFAPVNSIVTDDVDGDGNMDLIIAGNEYQAESNTGRYDASYGLLLKGNGKGNFTAVDIAGSGLIIDGDTKDMKVITVKNKGKLLLVARNDNVLKTFSLNSTGKN